MKPDRSTNRWVHYGMLALIYGVGGATLFTHTVLHAIESGALACTTPGQVRNVSIADSAININLVVAKRCDILRVASSGSQLHQLSFGEHEAHQHYSGYKEKVLGPGKTIDIKLTQLGSFHLHDHIHEQFTFDLKVSN